MKYFAHDLIPTLLRGVAVALLAGGLLGILTILILEKLDQDVAGYITIFLTALATGIGLLLAGWLIEVITDDKIYPLEGIVLRKSVADPSSDYPFHFLIEGIPNRVISARGPIAGLTESGDAVHFGISERDLKKRHINAVYLENKKVVDSSVRLERLQMTS